MRRHSTIKRIRSKEKSSSKSLEELKVLNKKKVYLLHVIRTRRGIIWSVEITMFRNAFYINL